MNAKIKEIIPYIIIIILVILIKTFIIAPVLVSGSSMMPTLHNNDYMILNKIDYKKNGLKRFDIIVIKENNKKIIKRVIGLPGDKIKYIDNKLYINDKLVKENFAHKKTDDFNITQLGSKRVPSHTYFVLGDNRVNSLDSRYIGFIPEEKILGKTNLIILPFSRMGTK